MTGIRIALQLSRLDQQSLLREIVEILHLSPLFQPIMPRWGTPFSVQMTNCGPLGWVSDKSGYRYQPVHPVSGKAWPPMPRSFENIWSEVDASAPAPEACLINYYKPGARMGLHQDKDEEDFSTPVVSISLGDSARFRLGGTRRDAPAETCDLHSGDVVVLSDSQRLAFHGIDRIHAGSSDLLQQYPTEFPGGGRINLTLRRVTRAGTSPAKPEVP